MTLSWKQNGEGQAEIDTLIIGTDPALQTRLRNIRVRGQFQAHISGFPDGVYFARLLDAEGRPASENIRFQVQHRNLGTAWLLFSLGLVLFLLLVGTMIRFSRTER